MKKHTPFHILRRLFCQSCLLNIAIGKNEVCAKCEKINLHPEHPPSVLTDGEVPLEVEKQKKN